MCLQRTTAAILCVSVCYTWRATMWQTNKQTHNAPRFGWIFLIVLDIEVALCVNVEADGLARTLRWMDLVTVLYKAASMLCCCIELLLHSTWLASDDNNYHHVLLQMTSNWISTIWLWIRWKCLLLFLALAVSIYLRDMYTWQTLGSIIAFVLCIIYLLMSMQTCARPEINDK